MRNVYPTDQVIHIWAHQGRESARNGSNVHFSGPELYSYSTTIAAIIDGVVYISANNMSVTTAKHISAASSATRHLDQFRTHAFSWSGSNPRLTHDAMIQPEAQDAIKTLEYALENTRTRKQTKLNAINEYMQRRKYILDHAARVGVTVVMPEYEVNIKAVEQYQERKAAAAAAKEAARIKAQKKQQKEDKKQFNLWLTTGAGRCPYSFQERGNDFITIKNYDKSAAATTRYVVTSQGAECPLDHAVKALKFYELQRNFEGKINAPMYKPYHTNGHKIPLGHFTLDSIDESGTVKAGCHTFTAKEIQRFINQWREVLGL